MARAFGYSMLAALSLILAACTGLPSGVQPVTHFELSRYLGRWYEIARLDHSFERGLSEVTADYSLNADGSIKVVNRGYDRRKEAWHESVGKALAVGDPTVGSLKVSFFGPFYGGYHIIALDPEYQHALVVGPNTSYLWILSRTPDLPASTREQLLDKARALGFDTREVIIVAHSGTT